MMTIYGLICTQNTTLSTIFGGAIYGVGIGISFAVGASTGGTAILGRLIQLRFPSVAIGKILMVLDGIIILTAFIIFGEIELTLLGILALIIASWAVDFVIGQLNTSKIAFVISEQGEIIAKKLVATSHRGVTVIDVKGAYTSTRKTGGFRPSQAEVIEAPAKRIHMVSEPVQAPALEDAQEEAEQKPEQPEQAGQEAEQNEQSDETE